MPLPYRGAPQTAARDISTRGYVAALLDQNLDQATVDAMVAEGLAPYVTKAYVDTQDQLNATKAFIDAGDATRLKLAQKEVINGIAGLGPSGRVNVSHVNLPSTQRFPRPFISPTAYNAAPVVATTAEVLLYPPVTVADPGFVYKLVVFGLVDANTTVDGEFPIVRVRQGSTTGPVVGTGAGCAEAYTGGVLTAITEVGGQSYTIPSWAATLDIVLVGGGGGGEPEGVFFSDGKGGRKGAAVGTTIVRGTTIPMGTNTINITIGAGGAADAAGGATTASAEGWGGGSAAGGGAGGASNSTGQGVGTVVFNGHNYPGGVAQAEPNMAGNAPGGGGAGASWGSDDPGGAGAIGGAWVLAYPSPNVPYGPVTIIPGAYNAQAPISGATTLHVMLARSGAAATVTASTLRPNLMIIPIPA